MSKEYLSMQLHKRPAVSVDGHPEAMTLPPGCVGIMFVFGTKKAARDWCGKKVELREIKTEDTP